jgi:putative ABC transport system permease protein
MDNQQQLVKQMEQVWKNFYPEAIFDYSFVEHEFNLQHKAEERLALIVTIFTFFAVFIACIGLFGLAFITAAQRTKEIGVRKVLGATITNIVTLLSKDIIKMVLIAVIIATPAAAWIMNSWLENFAYRIDIKWWVFAIAALVAVVIAFLTVSFHSVKAARENPVKNLRTE